MNIGATIVLAATTLGAVLVNGSFAPTIATRPLIHVTGVDAYDQTCMITHAWEDGSQIATCAEDGETYAYDADGGFIYDNGLRFYYRAPGTWYVAPEKGG